MLGYLPGYLTEEGYGNGTRFALLSLLLPLQWTGPAAVVVLAAVALWVIRTSEPDRPWHAAALMTGAAMLVTTPSYPWYGVLLVLLVAFGARVEWLAVVAGAYSCSSRRTSPGSGRASRSRSPRHSRWVRVGVAGLLAGAAIRRVQDSEGQRQAEAQSAAQGRGGELRHALGEADPGPEAQFPRGPGRGGHDVPDVAEPELAGDHRRGPAERAGQRSAISPTVDGVPEATL